MDTEAALDVDIPVLPLGTFSSNQLSNLIFNACPHPGLFSEEELEQISNFY